MTDQPAPVPNDSRPVWEMVREDTKRKYNVTCRHCRGPFVSHASATRFCSDLCMFMANAQPTIPSSCWYWRGKRHEYGKVERKKGEQEMAHRFAYELFWGEIGDGLLVRHICDEPSCVNPFHLIQGTHQDNSGDMVDSKRQAHGERSGNAKLTEAAVLEIRADEESTDAELAERYGVSRRAVRLARTYQTWRYLDDDMKARDHVGRQRYGTPLQAHNGRDALRDAYEEVLDLTVYLRQCLLERDGK